MTVAMGAWMKIRGHGGRPIAEMGAAMFLPFVLLLIPPWMGVIDHGRPSADLAAQASALPGTTVVANSVRVANEPSETGDVTKPSCSPAACAPLRTP
jgi:hypothetical protein